MEQGTTEDIIRLLPDSVANQIAAGEVIQRPGSVIKELVENSVDAGATSIEVVIKDAGKTLIQVIDNGKGMSTTDARMAFERHATSKIRCADDLFTLHTMGFRGEALPSIAAVSELELITRRACDELGTRLVIRGSHVDCQEPAVAVKGTNIKVKNLFYNFVARRRFLKSDSRELSHIVQEFERLALVNTDIAFKISSNGIMLHSLPRSPLKERISALFGPTIGSSLIPVEAETSLVKISGFVSLPSAARKRGKRQYLFVNGRNMKHPYFQHAIVSCFDNLIAKDTQPNYFINFTVSPDRIDVNVHPQKHEIKFEDEQSIWQILTASIREALGRYNAGTGLDFNTLDAPDIPPLNPANVPPPNLDDLTDSDYNPFDLKSDSPATQQSHFSFGDYPSYEPNRTASRPSAINARMSPKPEVKGWEAFYSELERTRQAELPGTETEKTDHPFTQIRNRYILIENRDGIMLVDQRRAHENILFNAFFEQAQSGAVASQSLLFSEELDLDATETIMLDSSIEIIERMGFRISRDTDNKPILDSIPGSLEGCNPASVLRKILDDLSESGTDVEADVVKNIALTMARAAAIKPGQQLTQPEIENIVSSLFKLKSPGYTPDGRIVLTRLSDDRLSALFS